jgi:predicted PurR-regulated permease PerM
MVSIPLAVLLALLKAAETGENFWGILLMVGLVYIIVQLIQDLIIVPKIMGRIMGMSPALILLSLSVWGYVFGFIGLIIALPLTTLALSYYKRYIIRE